MSIMVVRKIAGDDGLEGGGDDFGRRRSEDAAGVDDEVGEGTARSQVG